MCGICGEMTFDGAAVDRPVLSAMRDRLVHRGPDDLGLFVSPDGRAGLGFRRLRIIDLSAAANQPMPNEDGRIRVVFNGEIYNFRELRQRLEANGHQFRSQADTEVIVHLYEERGAGFVEELDGMFAIAIWDERQTQLILARDRAGKKPLFYYADGRRVVFASEIKALLAHRGVPVQIDHAAIPQYFLRGYVAHPATLYQGISQVNPASIVTVDGSGWIQQRKYWQLTFPEKGATPPISGAAARDAVRQLVTEAVRRRLVSDVPLGAFLSGGIDSTVIVGLMSRLSPAPVKTFTIGFDGEAAYDETDPARRTALRFGTEHTEFRVRPSAVDLVDRLIWHHDGPFGDSSAIPTYLVSQLTRQHVTVVLTGDGGDELFAGYLRFRAALMADRVPAALGPMLRTVVSWLPAARNERDLSARLRRFTRFMHLPLLERAARWNSIFADDLRAVVRSDVLRNDALEALGHVRPFADGVRRYSRLSQLLAVNFESYLPDDLLVKTDRCTMANSLEARAPFLDTTLVEYAATLPDALKIRGRQGKAILRDAFADLIPDDLGRRPKMGFGVPLDSWFRGELRSYVRDVLLEPSSASRDYLNQDAIRTVVDDHQAGRTNDGHRLWTLICFERWLKLLPSWAQPAVPAGASP
jgi:asparagine synthase (glutamine-hydrolysing)